MAHRIAWTESALQELEDAAHYIARDSQRYASALVEEALSIGRSLQRFPMRGRVVPELSNNNVRELFVKSYRFIYEIRGSQIVILAFIHGARRFPSRLV